MKPKEKPHYVSNRDFSNAVVEYCTEAREAKSNEQPVPVVTDYIASCFLKIAEGLSHKGNFVRYTYREEMVMDAVENMLKAIENYNIEAATRSGKPNAFAYFTQISWFAFLRRIEKEKKQQNIKLKFIAEADVMDFLAESLEEDGYTSQQASPFIDSLRMRIDAVKSSDHEFKEYVKEEKKRKRRAVNVDSDLSDWIED
jgi:DNA-directed RNA polymerase specialized sigma24 family protein